MHDPYMRMMTANITINGVKFTDVIALDRLTERRLSTSEHQLVTEHAQERLMRSICDRVCGELVRPYVRFSVAE